MSEINPLNYRLPQARWTQVSVVQIKRSLDENLNIHFPRSLFPELSRMP